MAPSPNQVIPSRPASAPTAPSTGCVTPVPVAPTPGDQPRLAEPLSRSRKIAYVVVTGALAVSLLGLLIVHLPTGGGAQPRAALRVTTTSSAPRTTTTLAIPTALKPGAEAAATALISSWETGSKTAALAVATQAAVTPLFAQTYASGMAEDRGCSTAFSPIVCTFGPPGGASPTDPIYEVSVSQAPGGWYVSSVKVEN